MKQDLKCCKCQKTFKRWNHEIIRIKDLSTYTCKPCKAKQARITKECPVCKKDFTSFKTEKKTTCSYACSNKHFRVGEGNGNWKQDTYRSTCFLYHKKKCVICDEEKIVSVHHYNENHKDNRPENLIPLCPTHHTYVHSGFRDEVQPMIDDYIKNFKCQVAQR